MEAEVKQMPAGPLAIHPDAPADDVRPLFTAGEADLVSRIAHAVEYREDSTGLHPQRVGRIAALIAKECGWSAPRRRLLEHAARLHDVGKVAVPERILLKPDRLTAEEFEELKEHTIIGAAMLAGSSLPVLVMAHDIVLTHHECWDGSGYPGGLRGEGIPLVGRIVAIADVFDALSHDRPYRKAFPIGTTLELIRGQRERQFDPALVDALLEIAERGELEEVPGCESRVRPSLEAPGSNEESVSP